MELSSLVIQLTLGFFRALGLWTALPLGNGVLSPMQRFGLAAGTAACLVPTSDSSISLDIWDCGLNFLIGYVLGLPAALLVSCAEMFGDLFDAGRGQSIGGMYDPSFQETGSTLALLARVTLWAWVLVLGVGEKIFSAFFLSFEWLPMRADSVHALKMIGQGMLIYIPSMLAGLFMASLPFAILFLCIDFSIGVIGKILPSISLNAESFLFKSTLGLGVLLMLTYFDYGPSLAKLAQPNLNLLMAGYGGG